MHPGRGLPVLALAGLALFGAHTASAAELVLAQPSACDISEELSFRAERALEQPLATAADVRCTVYIEQDAQGFRARLELSSPESSDAPRQRFFKAPTCEKLTDTLAVAIVLAIGSKLDEPASSRAPSAGSEESQASAVPADVDAAVPGSGDPGSTAVDATEPTVRVRWGASAAFVVDAGTLPAPGWGALAGVSLGGEALEVRLLGTYLWAREVSVVTSMPGSGAELALAGGSLLGCAPRLMRTERLELGVCIGAELGGISGRGTGLSVTKDGSTRWLAARADAGARWTFGPKWLGLDLMLGAVVPLQRSAFVISNEGEALVVHRPSVLGLRASLGLDVGFD